MAVTEQYLPDLLDGKGTLRLQGFKCGLSEHLLFRPPIHSFRALVPVSDSAIHIEGKDRICSEVQELRPIGDGPCGLSLLSKVFKCNANIMNRQRVNSRCENAVGHSFVTVPDFA